MASITSRSAESRLRKAEEYREKYVAELVEIEVEKRIGEIESRIKRPHLTDARRQGTIHPRRRLDSE